VCACVREKEREREGGRERETTNHAYRPVDGCSKTRTIFTAADEVGRRNKSVACYLFPSVSLNFSQHFFLHKYI